jgi:hypothetical protein
LTKVKSQALEQESEFLTKFKQLNENKKTQVFKYNSFRQLIDKRNSKQTILHQNQTFIFKTIKEQQEEQGGYDQLQAKIDLL